MITKLNNIVRIYFTFVGLFPDEKGDFYSCILVKPKSLDKAANRTYV